MKKIGFLLLITLGCSTGTKVPEVSSRARPDLHICDQYNDYVQEMCPSQQEISADLVLDYQAVSCVTDSLKMILESDRAAKVICDLDGGNSESLLPTLQLKKGT